jgi:hypothetical protein
MDFDTFLVPLLVISMRLGTAAVILAVVVLTHRDPRQPRPEAQPETQDDFTASVLRWGRMQDGVRK